MAKKKSTNVSRARKASKSSAKKKASKRVASKKGGLQISAGDDVRQTLAGLCRPVTNVSILGTVQKQKGKSVLSIDSVSAQQFTRVSIVANEQTKQQLSAASKSKDSVGVILSGQIVDGGAGSALVLNNVNSVTSLPLVAAASAQQALSKLASNGNGQITVKAKLVGKGQGRHLVLEAGKK